ncbi:MAG: hypothetical protein IT379_30290 [Deltaproteobacteria bacterium]|nr:hypothetical protein [Deltaproteobacteria bacterium]
MGHRAYIVKDGQAVYSHWGATLIHDVIVDWTALTVAVRQRLEQEVLKGEKPQELKDEQAFIDKEVRDVSTEAVFHLDRGQLAVYVPVWVYEPRQALVVFRATGALQLRRARHAGERLRHYARAYGLLASIVDPLRLAFDNAMKNPPFEDGHADELVIHETITVGVTL